MPIYFDTSKAKNLWVGTQKVKNIWKDLDKIYSSTPIVSLLKAYVKGATSSTKPTSLENGWVGRAATDKYIHVYLTSTGYCYRLLTVDETNKTITASTESQLLALSSYPDWINFKVVEIGDGKFLLGVEENSAWVVGFGLNSSGNLEHSTAIEITDLDTSFGIDKFGNNIGIYGYHVIDTQTTKYKAVKYENNSLTVGADCIVPGIIQGFGSISGITDTTAVILLKQDDAITFETVQKYSKLTLGDNLILSYNTPATLAWTNPDETTFLSSFSNNSNGFVVYWVDDTNDYYEITPLVLSNDTLTILSGVEVDETFKILPIKTESVDNFWVQSGKDYYYCNGSSVDEYTLPSTFPEFSSYSSVAVGGWLWYPSLSRWMGYSTCRNTNYDFYYCWYQNE